MRKENVKEMKSKKLEKRIRRNPKYQKREGKEKGRRTRDGKKEMAEG